MLKKYLNRQGLPEGLRPPGPGIASCTMVRLEKLPAPWSNSGAFPETQSRFVRRVSPMFPLAVLLQ